MTPHPPLPFFRKIAPAVWPRGSDALIYGELELDLGAPGSRNIATLPLVLSLLHHALSSRPEFQRRVALGGRWKSRPWSLLVAIDSRKKDLRFLRLEPRDEWKLTDFERACDQTHDQFRAAGEEQIRFAKKCLHWLPGWLWAPLLRFAVFAVYELGMPPGWLGFRSEPFGPVVVSNIGSIGLDRAYAPLVPLARNAVTVTIGQLKARPVWKDGAWRERLTLPLCFTADHRIIDGIHCAEIFGAIESEVGRLFAEPASARTRTRD